MCLLSVEQLFFVLSRTPQIPKEKLTSEHKNKTSMTPVAHILGFIVITRGRPLPVSNVKYPLVLQLIVVIVSDLDTAKPGVGLSHKI